MPEKSLETLRRNIARRKRADRLFFIGGGVLVFGSLLILAALFTNLLIDGWPALTQTFQQDHSTGRRLGDVNGTAVRQGEDWFVQLPETRLTGVKDIPETQGLVGQQVGITGKLGGGDHQPPIDVRSLKPVDTAAKPHFTGKLTRREAASEDATYWFQPDPLRVDLTKVPDVERQKLRAGEKFAFNRDPGGKGFGEVRNNSFPADSVVPLVVEPTQTRNFFTSFPSKAPTEAGILSAWVGTMLIMIITMITTVPLGVAAGVYLEEYAPKNRITAIIEINIANLAGVPSIIWGLMALGLFVYTLKFDRSVLTAGLTLGLLVLPIVIISTREAIRSIPGTIREASIGLGATKWQTTRYHVLPYSVPGILTGSIIAISRAIGETAPLVTIGALTFITFLPSGLSEQAPYVSAGFFTFDWVWSPFTVMPIQLFQWVSRPEKAFQNNAAAAGVVLLAMTLALNSLAIYLRYRLRKGIKW
jgi:phosphate transport system permease protein